MLVLRDTIFTIGRVRNLSLGSREENVAATFPAILFRYFSLALGSVSTNPTETLVDHRSVLTSWLC